MIGIPSWRVSDVWDRAADLLAEALEYGNGEYELEDILEAVSTGAMQLWMTEASVAVTTLIIYPRRQTCLIVAAAGDLDDLKEHLPTVEEWALHHGCDAIEVMGRKGWLRALPDYEQAQVHMRKDLACIPSSEIH